MELTLEETLNWLSAEVNSFSEMNGSLTEEAFFQVFTDEIIAAGEIDNADRCYFKKLGMRIDGYGSDPIDSDNELNVIVADYSSSETIENVNKLDIENVCKRSGNFISKCLSQDFINEMDVTYRVVHANTSICSSTPLSLKNNLKDNMRTIQPGRLYECAFFLIEKTGV